MPLRLIHRFGSADFLALWKINEPEESLIANLWMFSQENFLPSLRNRHWLATRVLLQELVKNHGSHQRYQLLKDSNGKPHLSGSKLDISLSHSGDFAAVIISEKGVVGIDIEMLNPRILRIAHKFVNDKELEWLGPNPSLLNLYRIWTAKESLFKLYGKGELDFKLHMYLEHKNNDWVILLQKGSLKSMHRCNFSQPHDEYILCWLSVH